MLAIDRIYKGDCLEVMKNIDSNSIDLIVTSPPYNCRKEYGIYCDERPWGEYYIWIDTFLKECYRVLIEGGTLAINVPNVIKFQYDHKFADTWNDFDPDYDTHRGDIKVRGRGRIEPISYKIFNLMFNIDPHLREPIIWVKGTEENLIASGYQMGCDSDPFLRGTHEVILVGSKNRWFHRGGTGRRGKEAVPFLDYTKDVWFIPPVQDNNHPAPFPIEIPKRLIRLFTHTKDSVVLDPFCGTGTTITAAMEENRRYIGIELNPLFIKTNYKLQRWTGEFV